MARSRKRRVLHPTIIAAIIAAMAGTCAAWQTLHDAQVPLHYVRKNVSAGRTSVLFHYSEREMDRSWCLKRSQAFQLDR